MNDPFKTMPAIVGLAGFSVATIVGIAVENPSVVVVGRGLMAMVACGALGAIVSPIVAGIVRAHAGRAHAERASVGADGSDVEIIEESPEKVRKAA